LSSTQLNSVVESVLSNPYQPSLTYEAIFSVFLESEELYLSIFSLICIGECEVKVVTKRL